MPFEDLAAEVATEVRLLRAIQAELAAHAAAREQHYRRVDPGQLARSLPGFAEISAPALVAIMGRPGRFRDGARFKSYAGLAPRASETGDTDRKGQPMSKAGPSLLRATLFRSADIARRQDPQPARIYYLQMTERGATHLKACCVVAGHLAERAWTVLNRGTPYVISDNNGTPITAAEAKKIIAEKWTVPEDVRKRRRSHKTAGKTPQAATTRPQRRGDPPPATILTAPRPRHQARHLTPPSQQHSQPAHASAARAPRMPAERTTIMPEPGITLDTGQTEELCELPDHTETITQWLLHARDEIIDDLARTAHPAHFHPRSAAFWLIEDCRPPAAWDRPEGFSATGTLASDRPNGMVVALHGGCGGWTVRGLAAGVHRTAGEVPVAGHACRGESGSRRGTRSVRCGPSGVEDSLRGYCGEDALGACCQAERIRVE